MNDFEFWTLAVSAFYVVTIYPSIMFWRLVQQDLREGATNPANNIIVID